MDHVVRILAGERRHLGRRIIEDLDEDASEAEADRRTERRIVDDAGIGLRDSLDHRLDQRAALETGVACVSDDRRIGVTDLPLVRAAEPDTAEVALMDKARSLGLDGDGGAKPVQRGNGFVVGARKDRVDHRHSARDQGLPCGQKIPLRRVAAGIRIAPDFSGSLCRPCPVCAPLGQVFQRAHGIRYPQQ